MNTEIETAERELLAARKRIIDLLGSLDMEALSWALGFVSDHGGDPQLYDAIDEAVQGIAACVGAEVGYVYDHSLYGRVSYMAALRTNIHTAAAVVKATLSLDPVRYEVEDVGVIVRSTADAPIYFTRRREHGTSKTCYSLAEALAYLTGAER